MVGIGCDYYSTSNILFLIHLVSLPIGANAINSYSTIAIEMHICLFDANEMTPLPGVNINFWLDNWTSNGPLRSLVHGPLTRGEEELKIKDIVSDTGWDWGKISITLPSHVGMEIRARDGNGAGWGQRM